MNHAARKSILVTMAYASVLCIIAVTGSLAGDYLPGQVHDYPSDKAASSLDQHQLSFEYPNDQIARAEFRSEEFYAIILKSAERCSLTKEERTQIQKTFPRNKVFMDFFECDESMEDWLTYTNTDRNYTFIAVFGGVSLDQAKKLFDDYNLADKYPGANIRKMQAVLVYS
ncbi:MAG: hypothetical protein AAGF25_10065 [Pseudomonadota bacterium]